MVQDRNAAKQAAQAGNRPTDHALNAAVGTPPAKHRQGRRPILRFVLIFGACVALFYLLTATPLFRETIFPSYLRANARAAAVILAACGQGTRAAGNELSSSRFSILIERGCDAVEPTVLFLGAVIASPVAIGPKVPALVFGPVVLATINLIRIITLFLTGIYWRAAFELMHVDVWQAIFIFLALLLWVSWALWALKRSSSLIHVASKTSD